MFIKLINNVPVEYNVFNLRKDNPNTSFPEIISDEMLFSYGIHKVVEQDRPDHNPLTQHLSWSIENIDGIWYKVWAIIDFPIDVSISNQREFVKKRRDLEISSGISIPIDESGNTIEIATDDISQSRITGAALAVTLDPSLTIQWKSENGFIYLDSTQIIAIAQMIRAHVQACFNREAELISLIESDMPYDIESGWPSTT